MLNQTKMSTIPFLFCTITFFLTLTASARLDFLLGNVLKESTPPVASSDCSTIVYDMVDCIGYLSDGDELKPSEACCSGIKSVLKVDKECLCEAIKMSGDMGIALNLTKAKSLPADCGVKHFSSSICDSSSSESPVAAPVTLPVSSPKVSPAPAVTAPVPSPKVSPAPAPALAPPKASSAPEASPAAGGAGEKGALPPSAPANGGANAISTSLSLVIGMLILSLSYLIVM